MQKAWKAAHGMLGEPSFGSAGLNTGRFMYASADPSTALDDGTAEDPCRCKALNPCCSHRALHPSTLFLLPSFYEL